VQWPIVNGEALGAWRVHDVECRAKAIRVTLVDGRDRRVTLVLAPEGPGSSSPFAPLYYERTEVPQPSSSTPRTGAHASRLQAAAPGDDALRGFTELARAAVAAGARVRSESPGNERARDGGSTNGECGIDAGAIEWRLDAAGDGRVSLQGIGSRAPRLGFSRR
jgi:hypothetical protein